MKILNIVLNEDKFSLNKIRNIVIVLLSIFLSYGNSSYFFLKKSVNSLGIGLLVFILNFFIYYFIFTKIIDIYPNIFKFLIFKIETKKIKNIERLFFISLIIPFVILAILSFYLLFNSIYFLNLTIGTLDLNLITQYTSKISQLHEKFFLPITIFSLFLILFLQIYIFSKFTTFKKLNIIFSSSISLIIMYFIITIIANIIFILFGYFIL